MTEIMRKLFTTLLALFILSLSWAQPGKVLPAGSVGKDYNAFNAKKKKQGPWIRVYKNKPEVMYYKGQFDNGVPIGVWDFFDEEGYLKSKVDHVKDSTLNHVQHFYPTGFLMAEGNYVGSMVDNRWERRKEGTWKLYSEKGVLTAEEGYAWGVLDGPSVHYFPNCKTASSYVYSQGRKEGAFTEFYESGKRMREGVYRNDLMHGPFKAWYEDGSLKETGTFEDGKFNAVWRSYHPGGKDKAIIHYEQGKVTKTIYINMEVEEYYPNGIPKLQVTYENGKKQGPFKEWYDKGQFVLVETSPEDQKIGIMQREKLTGQVARVEGDYLDDHYEGKITFRKETGEVERVEYWEAGKLVKTEKKENLH
jgi:antitoxin component YwqK of YwqJK toxin-antitoxin module